LSDQPIFGREKDIEILLEDLTRKQKTVRILRGESGVGKSRLLDTIYQKSKKDRCKESFVGYYNKEDALISEAISYTYPIAICLNNLIEDILGVQSSEDRIESQITRLEKTFKTFFKEQGFEILGAIFQDIAKKVGLEKTAILATKFYDTFRDTKASIKLGSDILSNQKDNVFGTYVNIFKLLAKEFPNRRFILIFDQLESVGKASIDFLLNLIKLLPESFHILIAFKTEERRWEDESVRRLYEDTYDKIVYDLRGKDHRLEGLTAEQIGDWIFSARKRRLPLVPDLRRIKENSGGLPVILEQWINQSRNLNYDEIKIDDHCRQLNKLMNNLSDDDKIKIWKMSVMIDPVNTDFLMSYLGLKKEEFSLFVQRVAKQGIFDKDRGWFRHELIKKCIEEYQLSNEMKEYYHGKLSDYCEQFSLYPNVKTYDHTTFKVHIEYAYHLHSAGRYKKSFIQNMNLGRLVELAGSLDLAERSYKRSIFAGSKIKNPSKIKLADCYSSLGDVYIVWGRLSEAESNYLISLDYYSDIKHESKMAVTLNKIGIAYDHRGEHHEALKVYQQALKISRQLNQKHNISSILTNIGIIYDKNGNYSEALRAYNEALKISRRLNDKSSIVNLLNNIGVILGATGQADNALKKFNEALKFSRRPYDLRSIAGTLSNMGNIYSSKGDYNKAMKEYEESGEISRRLGDERQVAAILCNIGITYSRQGDYTWALKKYEEALEIGIKLNDQYHIDLISRNIKSLTSS
jgi:tetratricopeptide (TPR) repeat protein